MFDPYLNCPARCDNVRCNPLGCGGVITPTRPGGYVTRALTTLTALCLAGLAHAETAEEIVEKARDARSVENSAQTLEMVIVGKNGSERVRELEIKVKVDGDIRKSLARFTAPSDVSGTALLLIDHPDTVDEQLLYLPAVKRTNRISLGGHQ